jgi:hypothetical protein
MIWGCFTYVSACDFCVGIFFLRMVMKIHLNFCHLVNTSVCCIVQGAFDEEGLHVYAFLLWKHGEHDLTLFVARSLAATLPLKKYLWWLSSVSSLD